MDNIHDGASASGNSPMERLSLIGQFQEDQHLKLPAALEHQTIDSTKLGLPSDFSIIDANASSQATFKQAPENWTPLGVAAGSGFVVGGALTAAGEYGLIRAVEPFAKLLGGLAFAPFSGEVAGRIMFSPPMHWLETLTPRPILIGAAAGAAMAVGAYEVYKHW